MKEEIINLIQKAKPSVDSCVSLLYKKYVSFSEEVDSVLRETAESLKTLDEKFDHSVDEPATEEAPVNNGTEYELLKKILIEELYPRPEILFALGISQNDIDKAIDKDSSFYNPNKTLSLSTVTYFFNSILETFSNATLCKMNVINSEGFLKVNPVEFFNYGAKETPKQPTVEELFSVLDDYNNEVDKNINYELRKCILRDYGSTDKNIKSLVDMQIGNYFKRLVLTGDITDFQQIFKDEVYLLISDEKKVEAERIIHKQLENV